MGHELPGLAGLSARRAPRGGEAHNRGRVLPGKDSGHPAEACTGSGMSIDAAASFGGTADVSLVTSWSQIPRSRADEPTFASAAKTPKPQVTAHSRD
jgi:hypothetical protein